MEGAIRTIVYVDGFNLYYGALKGRPYRWLNLLALSENLLNPGPGPSKYSIVLVKYFTARVSGAADPDAPRRQSIYLKALKTVPQIEVHFGSFLAKTIWRPTINLPVADDEISTPEKVRLPRGDLPVANARNQLLPVGNYPAPGAERPKVAATPLPNAVITEVHTMEEKGSDVNLAAHLVNDACNNFFDAAVVISNDTDLITPIKMARSKGKTVVLGCPSKYGAAQRLKEVSTYVRHINNSTLRASLFPDSLPGTEITKPAGW